MTWDISTSAYASKSFNGQPPAGLPQGSFFKSDGTKFYILDVDDSRVYQHTCATPWDLSTCTYDSVSYLFSAETTQGRGVSFSSDGTKMYVTSSNSESKAYQYTLTGAWDLSTASYASKSFDFVTQIGSGVIFGAVQWKPDGSVAYAMDGSSRIIYQYTVGTNWDLSTLSYASKSLNTSGNVAGIGGFFLKDDGAKIYFADLPFNKVFQYSLGTPYDLSTGSYDSLSFDTSSQITGSSLIGLFMRSDGISWYGGDQSTGVFYQYAMSAGGSTTTTGYTIVYAMTAGFGFPNGGFQTYKQIYTFAYLLTEAGDRFLMEDGSNMQMD